MVSHDIKLSPQEIKTWCLTDLIDMASDIITKNDYETYAYFCANEK